MTEENYEKPQKKSDVTRERILVAATKVFASNSYLAASIRMIAKEGGFDHGIIRYYYPSKALLFTAVSERVCNAIFERTPGWFAAIKAEMTLDEGFAAYLDEYLGYSFENPEAFKIIMQNISQDGKNESSPGYEQMLDLLASSRQIFEENIPLNASPEEIGMFINCFNTIFFNYVGSSSSQARLINMDPNSSEYFKWVKDTLTFMFLPRLKYLTGN